VFSTDSRFTGTGADGASPQSIRFPEAPNLWKTPPSPCTGTMATVASTQENLIASLGPIASSCAGLQLLVLHGSRARGDFHAQSDWDFAYQSNSTFDPDGLLAALADRLKVDRIDLADLERAGALLRYRVARDSVVLFERDPGRFQQFWLDAVDAWCDLAPVLEPLYAQVLETLPR